MSTETRTLDDARRREMRLRGSRDRLVDLLGLGETCPLQDPMVCDDRLTVPYGEPARVPIDPGQSDVCYDLFDADDQLVPTDSPTGTGHWTEVVTPAIHEDVTYRVHATKVETGRKAFLHESASIKVGLDLALTARILEAAPLDSQLDALTDTDARIIDYGSTVRVEVADPQEGVDYRLVHLPGGEEVPLSADVLGLGAGQTILLESAALHEDTALRIRATKEFDPATGIATLSELLEIVLPLKIRANPAAAVAADPSPVVAWGGTATIAVQGSQESVEYQLFTRPLSDPDVVIGSAAPVEVLSAANGAGGTVTVGAPPQADPWTSQEGFTAVGETLPGNGGTLALTVPEVLDDLVVIVRASKHHARDVDDPAAGTIPSALQLTAAALLLVEPDPGAGLALEVPVSGASLPGTVVVRGGQAGVFYHFRRGATGAERDPPAYFHQRDTLTAPAGAHNKGVTQLRLGFDFALARAPAPAGERSQLAPEAPEVELGSLPLGIELHVRAVRMRTGVSRDLDRVAPLPELPTIQLEAPSVAAGSQARIQVLASLDGDRYEPFLDGESIKRGLYGDGDELVFLTDPVSESTTFEVHITRPSDDALAVTRIFALTVEVDDGGGP